CMQALQLPYSF
nr:immunoglobulin light chain junction region [Macaca mulatta]MOW07900.1 immunoglobulin light chain junction region [Macaca mulatta]MOW07903.1 immunoglobulin light chain junction region [Macaca mulatta]MOW07949.1 immunoglobulin light chain junction region [Macaca mulatta]MOW07960.1 immunoglobulin light chain junction region [Macaca mulatta]